MGKRTESKRPMSADDYRQALASLELTQSRAGYLFGGKTMASGRNWALEGAPYHVALLLELMWMYDLTADDIDEIGAKWRTKPQVI